MSAQTKRLVVEFFGSVSKIAGVAEVELELEPAATVRDVLRALAASYPGLRGTIIDPENWSTGRHFLLNLDGRETIRHYDLQLEPGARLLLMPSLVGGLT